MANSAWQLEPRNSRLSARERTTSTISTTSTQSSFAFVSDPEISSSFAASLESSEVSDAEEIVTPSPALSSPISSADERTSGSGHQRHSIPAASGPASPSLPVHVLSSFSSLESLHSNSGRLVTLHLEKEQSIIWPSLIVSFCCSCLIYALCLPVAQQGPIPQETSPCDPVPMLYDSTLEYKYNMDPTSLVLYAIELHDIRKDKEEAFECFVYVILC